MSARADDNAHPQTSAHTYFVSIGRQQVVHCFHQVAIDVPFARAIETPATLSIKVHPGGD
jgi:hypothetical protein